LFIAGAAIVAVTAAQDVVNADTVTNFDVRDLVAYLFDQGLQLLEQI